MATSSLLKAATRGEGGALHLVNAYVVALASRDPRYADVINRGILNLADGMPLVWIGRAMGVHANAERVPGTELMSSTFQEGSAVGIRHYLYGSTVDVMTRLKGEMSVRFPDGHVVGAEPAPFRPLTAHEKTDLVGRIRSSGAQVVWVGLGTPRQDVFVADLAPDLDAVLVPVGAAFDFLAGTRPRAPDWMQRTGLEWVHRLASEPGRLWRRYFVGNVRFLWAALRDHELLRADAPADD